MKKNTKENLFEISKTLLFGILAGASISLGCIANLSSGSKIAGALFFVIGLYLVLVFNFNLFTGKVCYSLEQKPSYIAKLALIWLGNLCGAIIMAELVKLTRISTLQATNEAIVNAKLGDNFLSLFVLGIFCNALIYVAVHGFNNFDNPLKQTLALFFGVSVFVLCGFEHCVADMFYFAFAGSYTFDTLLRLLVITAGNVVGGLALPTIFLLTNKPKREKQS